MAIVAPERRHRGEPLGLAAKRRKTAMTLLLGAALCATFAGIVKPQPALAQPPAADLWQTYLDAAQASDASRDFIAEAVILNAALAFANKHDPHGQRPALTRLPLILAYGELDRKDLMKPLSALGMHIDVSNLNKRYNDFVTTIDGYARSYDDRWRARANDSPSDDLAFKKAVRFYGVKNSYAIEIAIRTKIRPDDKIGLAQAMGMAGLAYMKLGYFDCAGYDYGSAAQTFKDLRQMVNATATAADLFNVGSLKAAAAKSSALVPADLDVQVALIQAFETYTNALAYDALHPDANARSMAKTDWGFCNRFAPPSRTPPAVGFDALISRALYYHDVELSLTRQLRKSWPTNMLFGAADFQLAQLYKLEYEESRARPGQYPGSLAKAKSAYQDALTVLVHAAGPGSPFVHDVASDYVSLLNKAKLSTEAAQIEKQYRIKPSN